jgi:hypothetical protein
MSVYSNEVQTPSIAGVNPATSPQRTEYPKNATITLISINNNSVPYRKPHQPIRVAVSVRTSILDIGLNRLITPMPIPAHPHPTIAIRDHVVGSLH